MKRIFFNIDASLVYSNPEPTEQKPESIIPHFGFLTSLPHGSVHIHLAAPYADYRRFDRPKNIVYRIEGIHYQDLPQNEVNFTFLADYQFDLDKWNVYSKAGNNHSILKVYLPRTSNREVLNLFITITKDEEARLQECDEISITNSGIEFIG